MSCSKPLRRLTRRDWLCGAAGLTVSAVHGEELRRIRPADDISRFPDLTSALDRLRAIVQRKDHGALQSLMDPDFRVEFDIGKGPAAFGRYWHPESPSSAVWTVLGQLLGQGGALFSHTLFALPSSLAYFPLDLDLLSHVVAFRDDVALLVRPDANAGRSGTLRHEIVPLATPLYPPVLLTPGSFLEVQHHVFGRCYVASEDVWHPAGHRAFFEKRNGRWQWISLAAATLADPPELLRLLKKRV